METRFPAKPALQSEVFMAPGKTYDITINVPAPASPALPIFDREGSLSGNAERTDDAGMLAYIKVNGAAAPEYSIASRYYCQKTLTLYPSVLDGQNTSRCRTRRKA